MKSELEELDELLADAWCNPLHVDFHPSNPRWQSMPFEVRREFFRAATRREVLRYGHAVIGVFPVNDDGFHFAYTVGLAPARPDVIVTGLSSTANPVMEVAVQAINDGRIVGVPWDPDPNNPGDLMVFAPVSDDRRRDLLTAAVAHSDIGVAWQLVWTVGGAWPWEPEHYAYGDPTLPILAGPDWRPTKETS